MHWKSGEPRSVAVAYQRAAGTLYVTILYLRGPALSGLGVLCLPLSVTLAETVCFLQLPNAQSASLVSLPAGSRYMDACILAHQVVSLVAFNLPALPNSSAHSLRPNSRPLPACTLLISPSTLQVSGKFGFVLEKRPRCAV
jgi:hypothetical protein